MSETKITGTTGYHRIIHAQKGSKSRSRALSVINGARQEIRTLLDIWKGTAVNVHVVVTLEELTDSAGSPLMTREASSG